MEKLARKTQIDIFQNKPRKYYSGNSCSVIFLRNCRKHPKRSTFSVSCRWRNITEIFREAIFKGICI